MSCNTDICGEWEDEQETPTGQCTPRRFKRSCDAPSAYLNDTAYTVEIPCPEGTIGQVVSVTVSIGDINNPFSVAAANAQAQAQAQSAAESLRASTPCLYPNEQQECTETCPDGFAGAPITVVIAAGDPRFNAATQEQANALALAAACAEAEAQRDDTPCGDVSGQLETVFVSQTRNCEICGFAEFTDPSSPPRKYLTCTFSGGLGANSYDLSGTFGNDPPFQCEDGLHNGEFTIDFSGAAVLSAVTCGVIGTGLHHQVVATYFPLVQIQTTDIVMSAPVAFGTNCTTTTVNTKTTSVRSRTTACCVTELDAFGFPYLAQADGFGSNSQVLSNEDTEENAINRATFSEGSLNVALYEIRTGFTFLYREVEIELNATDLTSGVGYVITVPIVTADYGGANPVATELTYGFTAGGPTQTITDTIVAERGKQVTVGAGVLSIS